MSFRTLSIQSLVVLIVGCGGDLGRERRTEVGFGASTLLPAGEGPPLKSGPIYPPRNLSLHTNGHAQIRLEYICGNNAIYHYLHRRVGGGAWLLHVGPRSCIPGDWTTVTDLYVQPGTTYSYRIKATNSTDVAYSNELAVTSELDYTDPAKPEVWVTDVSQYDARINWEDRSTNEGGFRVYRRRPNDAVWTLVCEKRQAERAHRGTGEQLSCTNGGSLPLDSTWEFKVTAFKEYAPAQTDSEILSVRTLPNLPAAPTNVTVTYDAEGIHFTWNDNSNNEDHFKLVTRKDAPWGYKLTATVGANRESGTALYRLESDTRYCCWVEAENRAGASPSSSVCFTTPASSGGSGGSDDETWITIRLYRQNPLEGFIWYSASFPSDGRLEGELTEVEFPEQELYSDLVLYLLKPGRSTAECLDPTAWVAVTEGQYLRGSELGALFGGDTTPQLPVTFVACFGSNPYVSAPEQLLFNVRYR